MKACAEADGRQNAKTDPVWTPYELLVEYRNILHTVHTHSAPNNSENDKQNIHSNESL